jgi:peptidoglycan/xylan/chitin deacetylase (PgdA/CDA1 family)
MEIELAWGSRGDKNRFSHRRRRETETLTRLLSLCETLEIPITFNIVGHLLLPECSGDHDGPHSPTWFDVDPGGDANSSPLFFARDLAEMVRESETEHELCTHTFSHVQCDRVSNEVVEWEIQTALDLHERLFDYRPVSLVPPSHSSPPRRVLAENGIAIIRYPVRDLENRGIALTQHHHELQPPERREGVLETYCTPFPSLSAPYMSTGPNPPHPLYDRIAVRLRQRLHEWFLTRTLKRLRNTGSYLHHWTHLYNIANNEQFPPIEQFLHRVAKARDCGEIEVATMASLARRFGVC